MQLDLFLAFKERPQELEEQLLSRRFVLATHTPEEWPDESARVYRYFAPRVSVKGVWLYYRDQPQEDNIEMWSLISPARPLAATARLSTYDGRNAFDELMQYLTARNLRDHYDALLFDAYDGELLVE